MEDIIGKLVQIKRGSCAGMQGYVQYRERDYEGAGEPVDTDIYSLAFIGVRGEIVMHRDEFELVDDDDSNASYPFSWTPRLSGS